jgi:Kef-type K+ transport system membrane component KefB
MTPFLQFAFILAIILLCAKAGSYVSTRLGQPSVLGELLVGLVLGPSLVDLTHLSFITDIHIGEFINELGEIGVLILMFLAGLELHLHELAKSTRVSAYAGSLGVIIPVGTGWLFGCWIGLSHSEAIFLGLTLGATSVSISAQTLMELKVLKSRVGLSLLGAAVFDDILVILFLSIFLALTGGEQNVYAVFIVFLRMLLFLLFAGGVGLWLLPRTIRLVSNLHISQGIITFSVIILLFYGLASELLGGMAAITGTFIAGLMFARTPQKNEIENGFRPLAYGFFVPIFFVTVGLGVNLRLLDVNTLGLFCGITALAVFGKIVGAGIGARLGKFPWREAIQLGIGLVSRGEVGLIVAKIGFDLGYINSDLFSSVVGMVLVSTLITPPLLRKAFEPSFLNSIPPRPDPPLPREGEPCS